MRFFLMQLLVLQGERSYAILDMIYSKKMFLENLFFTKSSAFSLYFLNFFSLSFTLTQIIDGMKLKDVLTQKCHDI